MTTTMTRMRTDDFQRISLLSYGRPISGRDNLYFYRRVSGKGVALYHRTRGEEDEKERENSVLGKRGVSVGCCLDYCFGKYICGLRTPILVE